MTSSASFALGANVENLILTGTGAINGTGNDVANTLTGNSAANTLNGGGGNDLIEGGGGADTLTGGSGADVFLYRSVSASSGSAIDTINGFEVGVDKMDLRGLGASSVSAVDNGGIVTVTVQTLTGTMQFRFSGAVGGTVGASAFQLESTPGATAGDDTLTGTSGDDRLDGLQGADTLSGGLGNDTYVVDNIGDIIVENAGEGTDTVESSVNHTLFANVENLTLTGTAAINGTGNELDNVLIGNSAANQLFGLSGNDIIEGGGGADLLAGAARRRHLRLSQRQRFLGVGDRQHRQLRYRRRQDRPAPGRGDRRELDGQRHDQHRHRMTPTGNLTISVDGTVAMSDFLLSGGGGNGGNDVVTGTSSNDRLDGGPGADTMSGGLGNDTYVVENVGDTVVENAGAGTDTVESSISYTLGANVENLTLTGAGAINGTGNALNNVLTGNSAANALAGAAGNDVLEGGGGADYADRRHRRRHLRLSQCQRFLGVDDRRHRRLRDRRRQDRPAPGRGDQRELDVQRHDQHRHRPDAERNDDDPRQRQVTHVRLPALGRRRQWRQRHRHGHLGQRPARWRPGRRHHVGRPRQRHLCRRE